jgi:hypothetical protein
MKLSDVLHILKRFKSPLPPILKDEGGRMKDERKHFITYP